jgi:diguanylate cyclase (GGDEF)-like protein
MSVTKSEERLSRLVEILQRQYSTIRDFLDYSLDQAIQLTDSQFGYIYYYQESTRKFILNTWSKDVMPSCKIQEALTTYDLDKTGVWGEVVRQKKPIILNDFQANNPLKKGYPAGHVPLTKFMSVPVLHNGEIKAVIGLANKQEDYTEEDVAQITLLMSVVWNSTERKAIEETLRKSEYFFKESQRAARIGSYNYNIKTNTWAASDVLNEVLGINSSHPHTTESWIALIHPEDREEMETYLQQDILLFRKKFSKEYRIVRPIDNEIRWVLGLGELTLTDSGEIISLIGTIQDNTERHLLGDQLRKLAHTDSLTGIANRRALFEMANRELKVCRRKKESFSVIIFDIDKFKTINDKCGHAAGDEAISSIISACKRYLRDTDLFARFGGDEFVVVLSDTLLETAIVIAERLRLAACGVKIQKLQESGITTSCSFGLAILQDEDKDFDDLLARADAALLKCKSHGRNAVCCAE